MGYFDSYNPELLKVIPPDAKTVLEIGCGEGALCEAYRRVNPGVNWIGLDINRDALVKARTTGRCTDAYIIDEDADGLFVRDYDCLVFGDVLEHMANPWKALRQRVDRAAPGAQVLASIPNIGHWTVIRDLLNGEWEYKDEGLLDHTHLRFFTLKSIRAMFEQAGLQIFECRGRRLFNEGYDQWLSDALDGGYHRDERLVYQWVIRAIKPERWRDRLWAPGKEHYEYALTVDPDAIVSKVTPLHIHAVTAEECCARPRIHEPFVMLGTMPGVKCTVNADNRPGEPDIWIMQRHRNQISVKQWNESHWRLQQLLIAKSVVVAELDDHPDYLEGMSPDWLRACHAIQCSTEPLAEICRQYNPNVMVFENQIAEIPAWEDKPKREAVYLFFGAQNRESDWAPIMPALNRVIASREPGTIGVCVVHDRAFYDALELPNTWKWFHPFCEYSEYRRLLRNCDIALLPLEDTPFNRAKSDIKFLECAAEGVVVLASETVYSEAITIHERFGSIDKHGFLYEMPKDFEVLLRRLIESPRDRMDRVRSAYSYVRDNRLLSQHYRKRFDWYQSLITHKQRLTAELLARCPELAHSDHQQLQHAP